jgi:heparan-alpha-glucosaminide N-acetyltransferase
MNTSRATFASKLSASGTPSWMLFSGGACSLFLAEFSWVLDAKGYKKWAFPLVVNGINSIAAYLIAELLRDFVRESFRIHLGANAFQFFGTGLELLMQSAAVSFTYWLILFWLYRKKIFLRI